MTCAICFEPVWDGENGFMGGCRHESNPMHYSCINAWTKHSMSCPLCRAPGLAYPERPGAMAAHKLNKWMHTHVPWWMVTAGWMCMFIL